MSGERGRPSSKAGPGASALTIHVRRWSALARVDIAAAGRLDAAGARTLITAMRGVIAPDVRISLDLSEITAMDASGVEAVRACTTLAEHSNAELMLEDLSASARRALRHG